jgi:hypothetical protein
MLLVDKIVALATMICPAAIAKPAEIAMRITICKTTVAPAGCTVWALIEHT